MPFSFIIRPMPAPTPSPTPQDATDFQTIVDFLASMDSLVAAVIGGMIAVISGFVGALIQGRREHSKWKRDQRLRAYADFIAATDNFIGAAHRGDETELPTVARESLTASAHLKLFGPDKVYAAGEKLQEASRQSINALGLDPAILERRESARLAAREEFLRHARAEAKI